MSDIRKKVKTAKQVLQTQGVKGIASVLVDDKIYNQRVKFDRWFRTKSSWWTGKMIEIRGNKVLIDGCQFNVNSPAISTASKGDFYFDNYETNEREALKHFLDPELPVIELGGAMGVVACLTNKILAHPEKHVVVEANPEILPLLEENRDRNDCKFTIMHGAVAYGTDQVTFNLCDDFRASSAQAAFNKSVTVRSINLKEIVDKFNFDKFTLICDIEGGEFDLVKFDRDIFRDRVTTLMIEVHEYIFGPESVKNMFLELEKMNFKTVYEKGNVYVLQQQKNK